METLTVFDITAGVAAGIIIAVAFLWCCRAMAIKDEDKIPGWAMGGFVLIILGILAAFIAPG